MSENQPAPRPATKPVWLVWLHRFENGLLVLALSLMVLLGVTDLEVWQKLKLPVRIAGADGLIRHLTLIIGMLGGLIAARESRLLSISSFTQFMPDRVTRWTNLFAGVVATAVTAYLAVAAFQLVGFEKEAGNEMALGIPIWLAQAFLPTHSQIQTFKVNAAKLVQMIDRTIFCVSTDDNRHNLSGIFCEAHGPTTLRMVATDGHRLAMSECDFGVPINLPQGVIVPRKGFQELKRVLGDSGEGEVELGFSGTNGLLGVGSVVLSTRLVEGLFPDYKQVIPQQNEKRVKVARGSLAEALRRVSLLSQSRAYGVRLHLTPNALELTAEDPELGTATESLEVDYDGPELKIGFNARYILDVLAHVHDEGVSFEMSDDLSPGVLRPLEEPGFLAVVMPMRI